MQSQDRHPQDDRLPRRGFLFGLAAMSAAALASCTKHKSAARPTPSALPRRGPTQSLDTPRTADSPRPPDSTALAAAQAREIALIAAYDQAARDVPAAARLLGDFRAHHEAHLARITALSGVPAPSPPGDKAGARSSTAPLASAAPSNAAKAAKAAAAKARAVFAALSTAENAAALAGAGACAAAGPTEFAVVLAEIAGSESQHGALLPTFPAPVPA